MEQENSSLISQIVFTHNLVFNQVMRKQVGEPKSDKQIIGYFVKTDDSAKKAFRIILLVASALCLATGHLFLFEAYGDKITGTQQRDFIFSVGPSSSIKGLGGNDQIHGGPGADKIDGGKGDDYILGNEGNDLLIGGSGDDSIFGGPGNDKINGGNGDDFLVGNEGNDILTGGPGADAFVCDTSGDIIKDFTPNQNDTFTGNCKF